ncbi:MAG: rRNA maturation RNase YbeY [Spirochaetes bacterium]|nr:MAG: rRNA maturation RNase YbeY [Spirochaetota bacterium]
MNRVEISVSSVSIPDCLEKLEKFFEEIMDLLGLSDSEVSVLLCDDATILNLNSKYRGIDKPTDVLSFCQHENSMGNFTGSEIPDLLGDIVVSLESVKRNAADFSINYEEEFRRVLIHGLLHLLGMEHESKIDYDKMINLQEELLQKSMEVKLF